MSQAPSQQHEQPQQQDDILKLVTALEIALLPCLPARELQAIDRSAHPSHQRIFFTSLPLSWLSSRVDVERHARDFMEAAKKLQLFFIQLQHQSQPSKEEALEKEILALEEELKAKDELIKRQEKQIQGWKELLMNQRAASVTELERA